VRGKTALRASLKLLALDALLILAVLVTGRMTSWELILIKTLSWLSLANLIVCGTWSFIGNIRDGREQLDRIIADTEEEGRAMIRDREFLAPGAWMNERGMPVGPYPPRLSEPTRYGRPVPPFFVHYWVPESTNDLIDGVRMPPAVMELHCSPQPGCPACRAWDLRGLL
jgi:hypothetical protein